MLLKPVEFAEIQGLQRSDAESPSWPAAQSCLAELLGRVPNTENMAWDALHGLP